MGWNGVRMKKMGSRCFKLGLRPGYHIAWGWGEAGIRWGEDEIGPEVG